MDGQGQRRGAGITVRIGKGVGEGFAAVGFQRQKCRIAGVDGVGVSAVGGQDQLAIGAVDRLRANWPGTGSGRHAVGALHVIAQHITAKDGLRFAGSSRIAVVHCRRHIVDDVHVQ